MKRFIVGKSTYYRSKKSIRNKRKDIYLYFTFVIYRTLEDENFYIIMYEHNNYPFKTYVKKTQLKKELPVCKSWEEIRPFIWDMVKDMKLVSGLDLKPREGDKISKEDLWEVIKKT